MSDDTQIEDPKAVLAALERAKADAKRYREERDAARRELEDARKDSVALQEAREEMLGWQVDAALKERGLDAARVRKYLDLQGVKMEGKSLKGLDECLAAAQQEFPELFDPKRRVAGAVETGGSDVNVEKSTSQLQAEKLLRNSR
jgi:hypothetical protein